MPTKPPLAPFILLALALVGLGDALYLSYFQYMNLIPTCAIGGCEQVLTSEYSKFLGVPLSYIGLVFFTYMLALGVLLAIEPNSKALRLGVVAYAGIGLLFSIGFELTQIFVIEAITLYIVSQITSGLTFQNGTPSLLLTAIGLAVASLFCLLYRW